MIKHKNALQKNAEQNTTEETPMVKDASITAPMVKDASITAPTPDDQSKEDDKNPMVKDASITAPMVKDASITAMEPAPGNQEKVALKVAVEVGALSNVSFAIETHK